MLRLPSTVSDVPTAELPLQKDNIRKIPFAVIGIRSLLRLYRWCNHVFLLIFLPKSLKERSFEFSAGHTVSWGA
jgi:hypothetical protein